MLEVTYTKTPRGETVEVKDGKGEVVFTGSQITVRDLWDILGALNVPAKLVESEEFQ